ncbi:hypothetical protein [Algibacter sp. PT7-4]|uniref:hypothetical protein n=1 Tax=Algibacter ulvanivorans TaxID=3400999 RepID=UPI003AABAB88
MKANKYKILVLSDLNKSINTTLKSTFSFAKKLSLSVDIDLFCVVKPVDVVKKDNQLSAMRTVNQEFFKATKKLESLIEPYTKDTHVNIKYTYIVGHVKNEINSYIDENQPDIVVLEKKKFKPLNLVANNLTDFILKKHKGDVLIVNNKNILEANKEFSLGLLNHTENIFNLSATKDLINQSKETLKSFRIVNSLNSISEQKNKENNKDITEYVFEHNDNTVNSLKNYLTINNINLLCIERSEKNNNALEKITFKNIINKVDTAVLLTC